LWEEKGRDVGEKKEVMRGKAKKSEGRKRKD
jgi:hypothetical protein